MSKKVLICTVGAQGSIGTTIAAGIICLKWSPEKVTKYLITSSDQFKNLPLAEDLEYSGWDVPNNSFEKSFERNAPFSRYTYDTIKQELSNKVVFKSPDNKLKIKDQIIFIKKDINDLKSRYPGYQLVGVNILPASDIDYELVAKLSLEEIYELSGPTYQDLSYILAFIEEGIPVVNFTPNPIELEAVIELAQSKKVTICGRDGKTGQTYWKVVIASGFAARNLLVDGWYSTNILGNNDGNNLNDPTKVNNKIVQKSYVLNKALGYEVKNHLVRIDYYPLRKDNKEAYDVIDFKGFLDEEMSMRISLLCKDSILAAPMIIDLVKISAYLKYKKGHSGIIPNFALFFKYPLGGQDIGTFQDQMKSFLQILNI